MDGQRPRGFNNDPNADRSFSLPPVGRHRRGSNMSTAGILPERSQVEVKAVDYTPSLIRSLASLVKTRTGSVLSRGMILKSDHYPSGRAMQLDINLQGAPNFRSPRQEGFSVFGVAQPRLQGLKAILSVLGCRPNQMELQCIWFSTREEPIVYIAGRPYVLRDSADPRRNLALSDRAENLEDIEQRLKVDILAESARYNGLILTHLETESGTDGAIVPTWMEVDNDSVLTQSELSETLRQECWNIQYYRIPISKARPIEDNYLDAYLRVLQEQAANPSTSSLLFSCGMGAVRTTYAMCAACLIRRRQLIRQGQPDPFCLEASSLTSKSRLTSPFGSGSSPHEESGTATPPGVQAAAGFGHFGATHEFSKSLLRLTSILQKCLQKNYSSSAIEWLLAHPTQTDNLRKAAHGNYGIILSLLGCLDNGLVVKRLVDKVIDICDHVVNLREDILINRINYSLTTMEDQGREIYLDKAAKALEKYFFLIAFASYLEEQTDLETSSFGDWMKTRVEIWNQVTFLRKTRGSRLNIFAPVSDLSSLAKTELESTELEAGPINDIAVSGGQVLGDEWTTHVVENRTGIVLRANTLLKSDQWLQESDPREDHIRGVINFRNVPNTDIYALGQPSLEAVGTVIAKVRAAHPQADKIVWITLREEPIVYVNGTPFCLRRDKFSLRNMKDYSGVSAERLEIMEDRLKDDVVAELSAFGGCLLLHTETAEGSVVPVWEQVHPDDVNVVKEIMASHQRSKDVELIHRRIPITSEIPPDFSDFAELLDVATNAGKGTPIVVNCQLGRGRSTITAIILCLIQRWLYSGVSYSQSPLLSAAIVPAPFTFTPLIDEGSEPQQAIPKRQSYKAINHLMRVVRHGLEVKAVVDHYIDQCSGFFGLRESIEESAIKAEEATDEQQRWRYIEQGRRNLQRYFKLVMFQAYLDAHSPDTLRNLESFETYVKNRPVFQTFEQELLSDGIHALKPLEHIQLSQGIALSDEVKQVVSNRSGNVLSASTILKSDFFSNLQKLSLPERLQGAPNFRRVPLVLQVANAGKVEILGSELGIDGYRQVCGTGIPTIQGLKRALARVGADSAGHNLVSWTSLREEPVLYVAGRPHVLRLLSRPLENVESTGVTTSVVERIEKDLKKDVIRELHQMDGKLLLHDEVETEPGTFEIVPQWEQVTDKDIHTPREVFELVAKEGFKVDYARIPVTDEQAPLPSALAQLLDRVNNSLGYAGDMIFNCQMGRGRTTTGMVAACLISTILTQDISSSSKMLQETDYDLGDSGEGPSLEEVYMQGDFKVILQLVGVLSFGKLAKRITDMAIDVMQDVQNLRKTIYDYKLKVDASVQGSAKHTKLQQVAHNYLYRYGTLIVFANYLVEVEKKRIDSTMQPFPEWLSEHREITQLLSRRNLD